MPGSADANLDRGNAELAEMVRATIEQQQLDTIIVGGCDIDGGFRGKHLPAQRFCDDPLTRIRFADFVLVIGPDQVPIPRPPGHSGWWPSWEDGFGDFEAVPDLATFRVPGWLNRTGLVLCDFLHLDGSPVALSSRQVLRRVLGLAQERGLHALVAPELELFLLRPPEDKPGWQASSRLRPLFEQPTAYGVAQMTTDDRILRPLVDHLNALRVPIESWHPEGGLGQYEINMCPADPLEAADRAFLMKYAVREIAVQQDLLATFMARPFAEGFGSSFHLHQSVWSDTGVNLFHDANHPHTTSPFARHYIAGTLAALPDLTCLLAPNINSYKRFLPHTAAGSTATWGVQNRTAAVRVISGHSRDCRIELRTAGADANPYLVVAAALAAGLYGTDERLEPPQETTGDAYEDAASLFLPLNLDAAAEALEQSQVAKEYLGEDFVSYYTATRRWEAQQFRSTVTDWEISRYLGAR